MKQVSEKTIGMAWLSCIKSVMTEGADFFDEDVGIREILGLSVEIESPRLQDDIVDHYGDQSIIEHTIKKFEKGTVMPNRPFTYADHIYNKNGVDQFEWMVERLKNKPESKSATISLLTEGNKSANLPCLVILDAKIREEKLHIQFFFRSQNIIGRQYANFLAIAKFQAKLADRLSIAPGKMSGYIASAHIYSYDFPYAEAILTGKDVVISDQFYKHGPKSIRQNPLFKKENGL